MTDPLCERCGRPFSVHEAAHSLPTPPPERAAMFSFVTTGIYCPLDDGNRR